MRTVGLLIEKQKKTRETKNTEPENKTECTVKKKED